MEIDLKKGSDHRNASSTICQKFVIKGEPGLKTVRDTGSKKAMNLLKITRTPACVRRLAKVSDITTKCCPL